MGIRPVPGHPLAGTRYQLAALVLIEAQRMKAEAIMQRKGLAKQLRGVRPPVSKMPPFGPAPDRSPSRSRRTRCRPRRAPLNDVVDATWHV